MTYRRILIVDDEDDIREVAQVSLELVGHFDVLTAVSGRDGLERARASRTRSCWMS
jgi:CheY-like chemotaxis protein